MSKMKGGKDGLCFSFLTDAPFNGPGSSLFAVSPQYLFDLFLGQMLNQVLGRDACIRVHSHVKRLIPMETESPSRLFELKTGHSQIQQDAMGPFPSQILEDLIRRPITRLGESNPLSKKA
jgi:hypothetical protein